jgi:Bacterial Ig domain/Domain of unknown function (DUF4214)
MNERTRSRVITLGWVLVIATGLLTLAVSASKEEPRLNKPVAISPAFGAPIPATESISVPHVSHSKSFSPLAPALSATLADDITLAQKKNPGDTIHYTATITDSGLDATGVNYSDTLDSNTTLSGTVNVSPVTVDDGPYACTGNLSISIPVGSGVLANDYLGQNPAGTITASDATSANGGTVAVAADGSFAYEPAACFTGTDTFHYTLSNATGSSQGTVSVTISNKIWFINNTAGACTSNCNGRLSHPYTSLANFTSANPDTSGNVIFIYQGTSSYGGALTLKSNERLIGQGDPLNSTTLGFTPAANGPALPGATGKPTLTGTLTLATGVTVLALDLSTGASTGMTGSGGLTSVTVGESPNTSTNGLTVTTTTGTAVSLNNVGGTFTFRSITANGGLNGITLTSTTGSFTVTGDGTNTANGSGGTIQSTRAVDGQVGISMNSVQNVSLTAMNLHDFSNFAIQGTTVTNFTLARSTISGMNGNATAEDSIGFTNLLGSCSIDHCSISGGWADNLRVKNSSGTLNRLTASFTTFGSPVPLATSPNSDDSVFLQSSGTGGTVMNFTFDNCTFTAARGDIINTEAIGTSTMDVVFTNNAVSNNFVGIVSAGGGTTFTGSGSGNSPTVTFNISNNTFRDALGDAVNVTKLNGGGTFHGTISGNTIGVSGVTNSGSSQGTGLEIHTEGTGTFTTTISNNTIQQYDQIGMLLGATNGSNTLNATITGNTIRQPGNTAHLFAGLDVDISGTANGNATANVYINGNTLAGSGTGGFALADVAFSKSSGATINLSKGSSSSVTVANVIKDLNAGNPSVDTSNVSGTINLVSTFPVTMNRWAVDGKQYFARRENAFPSGPESPQSGLSSKLARKTTTYPKASVAHNNHADSSSFATSLSAARQVSDRLARKSHHPSLRKSVAATQMSGPLSGETVTIPTVPTLQAGKSVTIKYDATVNVPPAASFVQTQGSVSGGNFSTFLTTDLETGTVVPTKTNINTTLTWTGGTSVWETAGNWDFNYVPVSLSDVVIPNVGAQPTLNSSPTINSLSVATGRTLTINSTRNLTVSGNAVINGGILNMGAFTVGGTFDNSGGSVTFNGSSAQTAPGVTYNSLTINNSAGVTLGGDTTVNTLLTLTSGDLNTGAFTLTMPATATSGPATNATDVVGNVKRTGFTSGGAALSFGNPFNTIKINSGAVPTDITVNLAKSAPAGFPGAVQRTYTITPNGANGPATLRLHYLDSELNGNTPESALNLRRFNGTGWAPVPATNSSTADATNNWLENNAVTTFSPWTFSILTPTATNGTVTGHLTAQDGSPVEGAVVRLNGTQSRKTISDANGNYRFDDVETNGLYTVTPARVNYVFTPSQRTFSQLGSNTDSTFSAMFTGASANPLDTPEYFVRQQYLDFLGREPDEGGFNYWSDQILVCQHDLDCRERRRSNVSAAFFFSLEFQQRGGFVDRLYRVSYERAPQYQEFMADVGVMNRAIVGQGNWQQQLAAGKDSFIISWMQRPAFRAAYDNLADDGFVDKLIANTRITYSTAERDTLVAGLTSRALMRAGVLQEVAEDSRFVAAKFSEQFVLMEYFGYLRRDPDERGYQFWLAKLNAFNGNSERAEMVKAFLVSAEYRQRFPR